MATSLIDSPLFNNLFLKYISQKINFLIVLCLFIGDFLILIVISVNLLLCSFKNEIHESN